MLSRKAAALGLAVLIVAALLVAACAPAATPTPQPAATQAPATAVAATEPPSPTPTVAAPTAARVPTPTLAPAVKPTPVPPTTSAAQKPRYGGVLRTSGARDLTHYDLHQTPTVLDLHPLAPIYSLLVRFDFKDIDKVVPDLAERWEVSSDGKSYTFYLRKGAKWHNGQPVTAADVRASFERIIWPPKGMTSFRQAYFEAVERIETPDAYTVKLLLKRAQGSFPTMVSVPFNAIFPKALLDTKPDMKRDILGSGPFKFKDYIRGVQFSVEKNPDFFIPGRPYLDGAVRYIIPDAISAKSALVAGLLDMHYAASEFTKAELAGLTRQNPELTVQLYAPINVYAFIPNLDRKPWSDLRVRRAVLLATDEDALGELLSPGQYVRAGFLPPGPWAIPQEELLKLPGLRKPTAEDLAEAKRLLAEAGYPRGFTTTLLQRGLKEDMDQAIAAKDQLTKLAIAANLDIREVGAYNALRAAKDYDAMAYAAYAVELPEPDIVLSRYLTGSSGNYSGYSNPRVDDLYRQQSETTDVAQRKKLVLEMQRLMLEDLPYLPWYFKQKPIVFSLRVKAYYFNTQYVGSHSLEEVWLAE